MLGACACIVQVAMACRIVEGWTGRFDQEESHVVTAGLLQQSLSQEADYVVVSWQPRVIHSIGMSPRPRLRSSC